MSDSLVVVYLILLFTLVTCTVEQKTISRCPDRAHAINKNAEESGLQTEAFCAQDKESIVIDLLFQLSPPNDTSLLSEICGAMMSGQPTIEKDKKIMLRLKEFDAAPAYTTYYDFERLMNNNRREEHLSKSYIKLRKELFSQLNFYELGGLTVILDRMGEIDSRMTIDRGESLWTLMEDASRNDLAKIKLLFLFTVAKDSGLLREELEIQDALEVFISANRISTSECP